MPVRRLVAALGLLSAGLSVGGCSEPPRCEAGLCPVGFRCDASTGQCERDSASEAGALPYFGRVHRDRQRDALVGYAPGAESLLATWTDGDGRRVTTPLDGPALASDRAPAGRASALFTAADGSLHVAYLRTADGSVGYATLQSDAWHREEVAPPTSARGRAVAIARTLPDGPPVVGWLRADGGGPVVARRAQDAAGGSAVWGLDAMPTPAGRPASKIVWGREVALLARPGAVALAATDLNRGAVFLGLWSPVGWDVAQLTSAADGRASGALALASTVDGGLVVVWRDGRGNRVLATRATPDGTVNTVAVDDGRDEDGVHMVGTALAAASLADGRLVIAAQEASAARVRLAVQQTNGDFVVHTLGDPAAPLLFPALARAPDGDVQVHALAVQSGLLPPAGTVRVWSLDELQGQP